MPITLRRKGIVTTRYSTYLDILSAFYGIQLAPKERQVLNGFFWISNGIINTESRKQVASRLKITSFNLTNQILKLRRKKIIIVNPDNADEDRIVDKFIPNVDADQKDFVIQLLLTTRENGN